MTLSIGTYTIPNEILSINECINGASPLDGTNIDYLEIVIKGEGLKPSIIKDNILYPAGIIKCFDSKGIEKDDFSEYNKLLLIKKSVDNDISKVILYMGRS